VRWLTDGTLAEGALADQLSQQVNVLRRSVRHEFQTSIVSICATVEADGNFAPSATFERRMCLSSVIQKETSPWTS
jgi:hypothetical protein